MRNFLFIITAVLLFQSCTKRENKIDTNHEILNIILKDRLILEKKNFIYKSKEDINRDSIRIGKIKLIEKNYTDIFIDSAKRYVMIFYHDIPLKNDFPFQIPVDTFLNRIKNLKKKTWKRDKIAYNIQIESKDINYCTSTLDSTFLKTSFLFVSEPLMIGENKVLVSAMLYNYKYTLDKLYQMEKKNGEWIIISSETMISKEVEEKNETKKKSNLVETEYETTYQIFVGYSHEL